MEHVLTHMFLCFLPSLPARQDACMHPLIQTPGKIVLVRGPAGTRRGLHCQ